MSAQRLPFQARVIAEKAELQVRVFALERFLLDPASHKVDADELKRLSRQLAAMTNYLHVLVERIDAFPVLAPIVEFTHEELNARHPNGDEVFTIAKWNALPEQDDFNGYWDWVQQQKAALPSDLNLYKEAVIPGAPAIEDVDTFAMTVDQWHATKMEQGNRMLEIPEGTMIEVEDQAKPGEIVAMELTGAYHQVFNVGVLSVLNIFKDLPFGASIEVESEENVNDVPKGD